MAASLPGSYRCDERKEAHTNYCSHGVPLSSRVLPAADSYKGLYRSYRVWTLNRQRPHSLRHVFELDSSDMRLGLWEQYIWYLNIAAGVILGARLIALGLLNTYRAFFLYLVTDSLESLLQLAVLPDLNLYGWIYVGGQAGKVLLAVWVVLDLYWLALRKHPALAKFGSRTVRYLLGVAALISTLGLRLEWVVSKGSFPILRTFYRFERTMDSIVLVFLLLISVFLLWFPVTVPRNVAIYIGGFLIYSFERWAGLLMVNFWPAYSNQLSVFMLSTSFACLVTWLVMLRRERDDTSTVTGHRWNGTEADRLSSQLDAINARLMRFVRG